MTESSAPSTATQYQTVWLRSGSRPPTSASSSRNCAGTWEYAASAATRAPSAASVPRAATARRTRPRVTRTTPQQASTTRPSAVTSGRCASKVTRRLLTAVCPAPDAFTAGFSPAMAVRAPAASPRRTTGPNVRRRSAIGQQQVGVEAGAVAGVAGDADLVDLDQEGVAVAV